MVAILIIVGILVLVAGGVYLGIKYGKKITDVVPVPGPTPTPQPVPKPPVTPVPPAPGPTPQPPQTPVLTKPEGVPPLPFVSPMIVGKEAYMKFIEAYPAWAAWFKVHPEDLPEQFKV